MFYSDFLSGQLQLFWLSSQTNGKKGEADSQTIGDVGLGSDVDAWP